MRGLRPGQDTISISRDFKEEIVKPILKEHFRRDEFLGRIKEIVYFLPFSESKLLVLVERELEHFAAKARTVMSGMELTWDQDVPGHLAKGYNVSMTRWRGLWWTGSPSLTGNSRREPCWSLALR